MKFYYDLVENREKLFRRSFFAAVIVASFLNGETSKKTWVVPHKGDEKLLLETGVMEGGVKGILPACCLPRWGREGVTLIPF